MKPAFAEDLEQTLAALGPVFAERAAGECLLRCESIPGCLAGNLLVTSGQEIKSEITRLASRIGASDGVLPTFGFSEGWSARPHRHGCKYYSSRLMEADITMSSKNAGMKIAV